MKLDSTHIKEIFRQAGAELWLGTLLSVLLSIVFINNDSRLSTVVVYDNTKG